MVNPLVHWLRVLFCTRSRIPLRGLSGYWGIGFWIPLSGLSGFLVPPRLVVPAHPIPVPVRLSFEFSISFFLCFDISWYHCSIVPYQEIFCDTVCRVFLSIFPEYLEMVFSDSVSNRIKYHVYCSRYFFLLCRSVDYAVCR